MWHGRRQREDPDRDVDEEDPVPVDVLGEDPVEQRPDGERIRI
jgi:hypothetical protein